MTGTTEQSNRRGAAGSVRALVAELRDRLEVLDVEAMPDRERIDALSALEEAKGSLGAAQAGLSVAYADSQRELGCTRQGVGAELGLARRCGPSRALDLLERDRTLLDDLPETYEHLRRGRLTEDRAHAVADRVSMLDPAARSLVDEALCDELPELSDREVREATDRCVLSLDPEAVAARRARARERRHVSSRAAEDGMADLRIRCDGLDAAAMMQTLGRHADSVLAGQGGFSSIPEVADDRTRDAIMADVAVAWLTGRATCEAPAVQVHVIMTEAALFGESETPARILGGGSLPAAAAREIIGRRSARGPLGRTAPPTPGAAHERRGSGEQGSAQPGSGQRGSGAQGSGQPDSGQRGSGDRTHRTQERPPQPEDSWSFGGSEWDFDRVDGHQAAEDRMRRATELERRKLAERESERVTIRRLWASPDGARLTGIEARAVVLPESLRAALAHVKTGGAAPPDTSTTSHENAGITGPLTDAGVGTAALRDRLRRPPDPGERVDLSSSDRCYRGLLRLFMLIRDRICRIPWCGAPIRHIDHVTPHRDAPVTTACGGAGMCVGHNHAKEDPGHCVVVLHDGLSGDEPHTLAWVTPSGHTYLSAAPAVVDRGVRPDQLNAPHESPLESLLADLFHAA